MSTVQAKIRSMDTDLSEKYIVTACEDSIVRLFTIKDINMELLTELTGHTGVVTKAVFINQGELIASSDFSGKLIIWKLEGQSFVKRSELAVINGPIYDIAVRYTEGSFSVFCGCGNGMLKTVVFDSNFKTVITEQEIHRFGVTSVSCNSHFVATGGLDCSVALISKDGNIEYFKHHQEAVNAVALAPSDDEKHTILATCSEDGKLFFIFKEDDIIRKQEINVNEPCYSLDWCKIGLVLTIGYGKDGFKSFIQGENGEYEEVQMVKNEE